MCNCIETINADLAPMNTRFQRAITFGKNSAANLIIATEQVETGRGKKRAALVVPSFCPFCGEKYTKEPSA